MLRVSAVCGCSGWIGKRVDSTTRKGFCAFHRSLIFRPVPSVTVGSGGRSTSDSNIMKTIVTQYTFVDSFRACGRESQFTSHALRALFEHLERVEEDTDTELELDPIALCCEWAEYPSALEAAKDYGYLEGVDSKDESPIEWLSNRTDVVRVWENGVIIRQF